MAVLNTKYKVAYGLSDALLNVFPAPIISNRAPTTADKAQLGTVWDFKSSNAVYILTSIVNNSATWTSLAGGAASFSSLTVNPGDINVTAGNINATAGAISAGTGLSTLAGNISNTNGNVLVGNTTVGVNPSTVQFLKSRNGGAITSGDGLGLMVFSGFDGTQYTEGAGIQSTSSGTIANGRLAANLQFFTHPDSTTVATLRMTIGAAGNITIASPDSGVALTITAGGQTITAGNLTVTAGQALAATLVATGDVTGAAAQTAITNVINTTQGAGTLTIKSATANSTTNTGFIKIYVGGVANFIPYFVNITP